MALGAVLLSVPLAILGVGDLWAAQAIHVYQALLAYAGLGTLIMLGYALIIGTRRD